MFGRRHSALGRVVVGGVLAIAFNLVTEVPSARGQTKHDDIHREFVELVRTLNKGAVFDCKRISRDRSGCFFFSTTAQRQTIWQFTSDTAMSGGSAIEMCTNISHSLLEAGKETLTSVTGILNEPLRTSLLCTFKYVRTDGKR